MAVRALSAAEQATLANLPAGLRMADRLLREKGLPTRRNEQWKWSDLRAAFDESVQFTARKDIDARGAEAAAERNDFVGLLAGAFGQTDTITLAAGESAMRIDRVEPGQFTPRALDVDVADGASFTRIVIQRSQTGLALDSVHVRVGTGATFRQFILAEGAKLARMETHVDVAGEEARVDLRGVYLAGAARHADLTSVINHRVVGGTTRQLIKGAARKGGRGVFQGRIEVARGAQKTDARQHHHGLLLAEGAEIYAKPELEIYADDVQCAHGNTAGALDEGALFYMRARGIPQDLARAMLTEAFLLEAVPDYLPQDVNAEVISSIRIWLGGAP
jgi:Fe-S cluster assembly protein SufD